MGKQTYRWSDLDFEANAKDGIGIDWPIGYKDIEPRYEHVEKHISVSGEALGLPQLPDSILLKPMKLNCVEEHFKKGIAENYDNRVLTIGRVVHITEGSKPGAGRGTCQYRNQCKRGCPYGAYFSLNSSTIPMGEATGNITIRPNSIVHEVLCDKDKRKATGVRIIDANTKEVLEFKLKIVFLCASYMASTVILMQPKSDAFPKGMGENPKTSVLNKNNQLHESPNMYLTDGACMTSSGDQNSTLTYMTLTARAAIHAVKQLKKMNL